MPGWTAQLRVGAVLVLASATGCGDGGTGGRDPAVPDARLPAPTLLLAPAEVEILEGTRVTFQVSLSQPPPAPVTVDFFPEPAGALWIVEPQFLSFDADNFATAQMVTALAAEDDDLATSLGTVDLVSAVLPRHQVRFTIRDDDHPTLVVSPPSLTLSPRGFGYPQPAPVATITVSLSRQPLGDVTVLVSGANSALASAQPGSLWFGRADFATPQTLTITGHPEDHDLISESTTLTLQAPWGTTNLVVSQLDNSEQQLRVSPTSLTLREGDSALVGISLESIPATPAQASFINLTPDVVLVEPARVSYGAADWPGYLQVTVKAIEDLDSVAGVGTVEVRIAGLVSRQIHVDVIDND